jgi:hypothetical protein
MRRGEVRALEPPVLGALVHHRHEAALGAGEMHRERDGRVVPRHDQQAVQERLQPDALPARQEADPRAAVAERRARDPDRVARAAPLHGQERGHDLREACHRQHEQRPLAPEDVAGVHVEDEPCQRGMAQANMECVDPGERHRGGGLALDERRRLTWRLWGSGHGRRPDRQWWARRSSSPAVVGEREQCRGRDPDRRGEDGQGRDQPRQRRAAAAALEEGRGEGRWPSPSHPEAARSALPARRSPAAPG